MSVQSIERDLRQYASTERAEANKWFFKTAPGEYGHGDRFMGLRVPDIRKVTQKHKTAALADVDKLIESKWHEARLCGLLIMVLQFESKKASTSKKRSIYNLYLKQLAKGNINNWDLVDSSAHKIIGGWLMEKDRSILETWAQHSDLWHRRVSIIATARFIANDDFDWTLKIARLLLNDEHDLIHKATGWMLREVGKRDRAVEEEFLKPHYKTMPRTMLRYAIERFPESLRKDYLHGRI